VKIDAILSPGVAPIDQRELLPEKWMEGMSDLENLRSIGQLACS